MKLEITLNLENYENIRFETNEYKSLTNCYAEIHDFLLFWTSYTDHAKKLLEHISKMTKSSNKPTQMMTALDLENIEIADRMAAKTSKIQEKIYNIASKSGQPYKCSKCGGFISWDLRPERVHPLHCDKLGQIIGDGDCPAYNQ